MNRLACLLVVLLVSVAAQAQTVAVSGPAETLSDGTRCATVERTQVCRTPTDDGWTIIVSPAGAAAIVERARWTTGPYSAVLDFRAFQVGDLLVVATLDAISNGLGVSSWTLDVVPGEARTPTYSFTVKELGVGGGSFGTWNGRPVLWATEWWSGPDPSGRRGPGTYLVGRPFYLEATGLVPVTGLPFRARRLLNSFTRAQGEALDWLTDRRAETWRRDPLLLGTATETRGTVASADTTSSPQTWEMLRVGVRTEAGETLSLASYGAWESPTFSHIGSGASGRVWPEDYRLADVSAWLTGKPVRYVRYGEEIGGVLWLE